MRNLLLAATIILALSSVAQAFDPLYPTYWGGPSIYDYNRAGIYFYAPRPVYRGGYYGAYSGGYGYYGGYGDQETANELRQLRYAIEDAEFSRRLDRLSAPLGK
ncbi:MAG: hypothetical protein KDA57_22290 [Planctomycetales bacterium]|nr:hypothetical protein [Planctomycetales bacterium]